MGDANIVKELKRKKLKFTIYFLDKCPYCNSMKEGEHSCKGVNKKIQEIVKDYERNN